ncbi:CD3324 family protein [Pseudoneobacillus sp. C159]
MKKATELLPEFLINEIQKYVQGETIYIPKSKDNHKKWGSVSGGREEINQRNLVIKQSFLSGKSIEELADEFFLSTETIKKIVYNRKLKISG